MTQKDKNTESKYSLPRLLNSLREKFDLNDDQASQTEVIDNVSKGVEFKGTNLWVLIFATFIASLGLNINSAAVIIGAMLISPLMGPIMGIGLSLGINNFELMKRSLRNFGLMVVVSIITSTIFFILSPLSSAQSELLARTQPTIYDVLIALFGGLAGFVAQSRRDRTSTVIPGVAIATALMPPLCTAGYGIATGQLNFFGGAIYLFFINTVFIALATYGMVRFLKYGKKQFLDKAREKRVKQYMWVIIVLTVTPSIFMAYSIVQNSIFDSNADRYIASVFNFSNTQVIDYSKRHKTRKHPPGIEIILIGESLSQDVIDNCRAQLPVYGLANTDLVVKQSDGSERVDVNTLSSSYIQLLDEKNMKIAEMEHELSLLTTDTLAYRDISREAGAFFENISRISMARQPVLDMQGRSIDTILVCVVSPKQAGAEIDTEKLSKWLATRTKCKKVKIYTE